MFLCGIGVVAFEPATPAHADPACVNGGVYVLFARGATAAFDSNEAIAFKYDVLSLAGSYNVPGAWAELGNLDNVYNENTHNADDPAEYPASGVGFNYINSVNIGANELYIHLLDRVNKCPRESIVIGGYSEGAQVVLDALWRLSSDSPGVLAHIGYVAVYGDTKAAGCPGDAWIRGSAGCRYGVFAARSPYVPPQLSGRFGSWCDIRDGACTGSSLFYPIPYVFFWSSHTTAYAGTGGWIDNSSHEMVNRALDKLNQINAANGSNAAPIPLPSYTITPPDPSTSPPPPPPALTGASPIQNGGFNQDVSHWSVSGSANLAYNNDRPHQRRRQ